MYIAIVAVQKSNEIYKVLYIYIYIYIYIPLIEFRQACLEGKRSNF